MLSWYNIGQNNSAAVNLKRGVNHKYIFIKYAFGVPLVFLFCDISPDLDFIPWLFNVSGLTEFCSASTFHHSYFPVFSAFFSIQVA